MSDRSARARARGAWPGHRSTLSAQGADDVIRDRSPAQLIAMVWQLTLDSWASTGQPIPDYPRHLAPGRVIRRP